jgi:pimeloyl-ACP methyl ester carboxylesterase
MRRTITNEHGEKLAYKYHRAQTKRKPAKNARPPLILIGHGVTGNLERPLIEALAKASSEGGLHTVRFSFSGNGESEGKFGEATITKQIGDLGAMIDACEDAGYDVTYIGHSMGAAVGILRASEDRRLKNLVCLAPMIHTRRFVDAEFGEVTPGKGNMWGEKGCRLTTAFVEDLKSIDTVAPRMSEIECPLLVIHGSEDDVIPWSEAVAAHDFANEPKKLIQFTGAGHTFDGKASEVLAKAVVSWIKEQIKAAKLAAKEAKRRPKKTDATTA